MSDNAYKSGNRDYIVTYSKKRFNPITPNPEDIVIEDIAHALSFLSRANGHSETFYSVAQHSLNCAYEAKARGYSKRIQLACLLHDGSEAYIGDVTRPFKQHLHFYLSVEDKLEAMIWETLGVKDLTAEERVQVFDIDDDVLFFEFKYLMKEIIRDSEPTLKSTPSLKQRPFDSVEKEFLDLFNNLTTKS